MVKGAVEEKEAKDVKKRRAGSVTEKIHGWASSVREETYVRWMEWKKPWNKFSEAVQILETEKSRGD